MTTPDTSPPGRIVVRGVNWLGDAVMTTPALLRLKERFPSSAITLVCASKLAELWTGFQAIDEVIPFESSEGLFSVARRIRNGQFDTGIALPNSTRAALELRLGGVPLRLGYGGRGRMLLLNRRLSRPDSMVPMRKLSEPEIRRRIAAGETPKTVPPTAHQIHHYLHLTGAMGADETPLAPMLRVGTGEMAAFAAKFLADRPSTEGHRPLLGLNPGAEYGPAKRWPAARFAAAAAEISRTAGADWILFGGKGDTTTAADIARQVLGIDPGPLPAHAPRIWNLAGKTSLRELMAGLRLCKVILTNDSGPMHVAAAVGTPVVVPFGSTSRELTGPGLPGDSLHALLHADAPCSPCFLRECPVDFRCMAGITTAEVVEAVRNRMVDT